MEPVSWSLGFHGANSETDFESWFRYFVLRLIWKSKGGISVAYSQLLLVPYALGLYPVARRRISGLVGSGLVPDRGRGEIRHCHCEVNFLSLEGRGLRACPEFIEG